MRKSTPSNSVRTTPARFYIAVAGYKMNDFQAAYVTRPPTMEGAGNASTVALPERQIRQGRAGRPGADKACFTPVRKAACSCRSTMVVHMAVAGSQFAAGADHRPGFTAGRSHRGNPGPRVLGARRPVDHASGNWMTTWRTSHCTCITHLVRLHDGSRRPSCVQVTSGRQEPATRRYLCLTTFQVMRKARSKSKFSMSPAR